MTGDSGLYASSMTASLEMSSILSLYLSEFLYFTGSSWGIKVRDESCFHERYNIFYYPTSSHLCWKYSMFMFEPWHCMNAAIKRRMEKDVDEVGRIALVIKAKIEALDKDVRLMIVIFQINEIIITPLFSSTVFCVLYICYLLWVRASYLLLKKLHCVT